MVEEQEEPVDGVLHCITEALGRLEQEQQLEEEQQEVRGQAQQVQEGLAELEAYMGQ